MMNSKWLAVAAVVMLAGGVQAGVVNVSGDAKASVGMPEQKVAEQTNFATLDADSDAAISREEAAKDEKLAAAFEDLDVNLDGQLSAEEFSQYGSIDAEAH